MQSSQPWHWCMSPSHIIGKVPLPLIYGIPKLCSEQKLYYRVTRKHSYRMCTARLEIIRPSVSAATTRCCSCGAGPQMNKFVQVSSDHHQISLAGGPRSNVCVWGGGRGGTLPSLPCDLSHVTYPPSPTGQTHACENIFSVINLLFQELQQGPRDIRVRLYPYLWSAPCVSSCR